MTIINLTVISLLLTIALIVALISFVFVVNQYKKLTRAKDIKANFNGDIESNIAMLVTKQLIHNLNGLFEVNDLSIGETIYYKKMPVFNNEDNQTIDSTTNHKSIKAEAEKENIGVTDIMSRTDNISDAKALLESESDNDIKTNIDPNFLHSVTSLIYKEITNTDNIIEYISSELCISSSQLNRKIKLMTGMTTSHFILKTRLNKAKKQLTLTQKPIGEIAMGCGFNDFAYFSRSFKKEFEMTPTTFQRIPH